MSQLKFCYVTSKSIFHIVLLMFHDVIRQFDCKKDIRYGYTRLEESVCGAGGGYSHHNTQVRF